MQNPRQETESPTTADAVHVIAGVQEIKTQLFADQFHCELPRGRKRKHPSGAKPTKRRKHKQFTQKKATTKAPKLHLTEEQKQERKRALAKENAQRRKELGLCKSCPNKTVNGQTRYQDCAEKHRAWLQPYSEDRRRAQGIKPRQRTDDTAMEEELRREIVGQENQGAGRQPKRIRSEAYKQKRREKQASLRAERASLGLCRSCGEFSVQGQIRCPDCVLKHRQSEKRARVRTKVQKEFRQSVAPSTT